MEEINDRLEKKKKRNVTNNLTRGKNSRLVFNNNFKTRIQRFAT